MASTMTSDTDDLVIDAMSEHYDARDRDRSLKEISRILGALLDWAMTTDLNIKIEVVDLRSIDKD